MTEHQIDMPDEAVIEIFSNLPTVIRVKLEMLMISGIDSVAAFDSLTEEEQQTIEDAVESPLL